MTGTPWLSVLGVGADGIADLPAASRALLDAAECLVGGARHLAMLPGDARPRLVWQRPLTGTVARMAEWRGRRVCVLATGDPMCFGIGTTLARHFEPGEMHIVPAPSAFALACARLAWPEHEVELLTLHGRPIDLLAPALRHGARLVLLSHDATTPARVAAYLADRGYGDSRLHLLERMGAADEARRSGIAGTWQHAEGADLNTLAVELVAGPGVAEHARVPGLPDDTYLNDGQITRSEVRASTLAALAPGPGALLWDVGAGCGSIAIEWMRSDRRARAIAIEPDDGRRNIAAQNAARLGVPGLEFVNGRAPDALDGLEAPDAVFIGGGISTPGMVEACWSALRPGGRLVANVVTLEGEAVLIEQQARLGGDLVRISVARSAPVGSFRGWRAMMPVTRWRVARERQ